MIQILRYIRVICITISLRVIITLFARLLQQKAHAYVHHSLSHATSHEKTKTESLNILPIDKFNLLYSVLPKYFKWSDSAFRCQCLI